MIGSTTTPEGAAAGPVSNHPRIDIIMTHQEDPTITVAGIVFSTAHDGRTIHPSQIRRALRPLEMLMVAGRLNEVGQTLSDFGIPIDTFRRALEHVQALGGCLGHELPHGAPCRVYPLMPSGSRLEHALLFGSVAQPFDGALEHSRAVAGRPRPRVLTRGSEQNAGDEVCSDREQRGVVSPRTDADADLRASESRLRAGTLARAARGAERAADRRR